MRRVIFENDALEHLQEWGSENRKTFQRIFKLLAECQRNPFEGTGKPEPLKANLKRYCRAADAVKAYYRRTSTHLSSF
jgi:toxin YoeB